jgi:hypothetical protein
LPHGGEVKVGGNVIARQRDALAAVNRKKAAKAKGRPLPGPGRVAAGVETDKPDAGVVVAVAEGGTQLHGSVLQEGPMPQAMTSWDMLYRTAVRWRPRYGGNHLPCTALRLAR